MQSLFRFLIACVLATFCTLAHSQNQAPDQAQLIKTQRFLMQLNVASRPGVVHASLELTDSQKEKLAALAKHCMDSIIQQTIENGKVLTELQKQDVSKDELESLRKELQKKQNQKWGKLFQSLDSDVNEVLLPHQVKRLKQLALQQELQQRAKKNDVTGDTRFSAIAILAKDNKLTPEQIKKLESRLKQIKAEYKKELRQLQEKTNKKILEALPSELREKITEQIGEIHFSNK